MFEDLMKKLKAQVAELRKKLPGGGGDDDYDDEDEDDYEEKYHGDEGDDEDFEDDGKTVQVQVKDLMEGDDSEEDDEEEETETDIPTAKEKTQKIYSDDEEDEDDDDDEVDADAAVQKRKKMIMYGAVAALVVVLVVPEFMKSEPEPQPTNFKRPPKPKNKKKRKKRKKPKTAKTQETKAEAPAQKAVEDAVKPKVADIPPETAAGLPPKVEPTPEAATPAPTEAPKIEPTPEAPAPAPAEAPKVAEPEKPAVPAEIPPAKVETQDDGMIIKLGEEASADTAKDSGTGSATVDDMMSKIDKKLEYVAPPNYERSGRGLVYNCVGKHWACVDKFSYLTCRENTNWSSQNGKNPECHTKNVYASVEDCQIVQRHYIESSEPTGFCSGKAPSGDDGKKGESKPMTDEENSEAAEELDLLE